VRNQASIFFVLITLTAGQETKKFCTMWKFLHLQITLLGGDSMWSSVSYGVKL